MLNLKNLIILLTLTCFISMTTGCATTKSQTINGKPKQTEETPVSSVNWKAVGIVAAAAVVVGLAAIIISSRDYKPSWVEIAENNGHGT